MKLSNNQFLFTSSKIINSMILIATIAFIPGISFAVDKDAHEDQTELRIKELHGKLKITSEQEGKWSKVAETMLSDAKTMDALTQVRIDHDKDMTAVDDLKSYSAIAEAHANGIKTLIPVFEDLYASLSDAQKKAADSLFHDPQYKKGHKKAVGN